MNKLKIELSDNDNAEMRQSTYLKLKPLIEPYFTSSISDSDLPIKRYHEDTYITMVLSKDEDAEKEGCQARVET